MKRLHYKLSAALLLIVLLLGAAFYRVDRYSVRTYYEELSQRLNASLAMYVVNEEPLIRGGIVNREALSTLASRAMVINPTAEIYLLAPDGRILGHALPPEEVAVERVDLTPIKALLAGTRPLPIKGINPREPDTQKVFSVFPVADPVSGDTTAGYLYVVLGGSQYEAVAAQVAGSDKQRVVAASIVLMVVGAFAAGVLLFSFLTRRLRRLTTDVTTFTDGQFDAAAMIEPTRQPGDEIDRLRNACYSMASTIRRQLTTLEEDDRLRRELVTNISHDLRTPLASMQGYIETLIIKDEVIDPQARLEYLEVARKHATHLGRLIQDLFELAMLDANRVSPVFEEFALLELIYDVVQEFELQAEQADVRLQVDSPETAVFIRADISLIQRVLENLVGNALKFTPAGGLVSISVRPTAAAVAISVSDTGPGIAAEVIPHIFDRFYRADVEPGRNNNGSMGLGLAIARRILELHGSEIHVTSEERHGTRFDFNLPLEAQAA